MTIWHGRPEDAAGRLPVELAVYDLLDALAIPYLRVDHAPAHTMEDCQAAEEAFGTEICKNLLLCNRQETQFYLLMIPGQKKFLTKDLSRQIGSARLSFAKETYMVKLLGLHPGAGSVMGLMNDTDGKVKLLMDREVAESRRLGCHPCVNTSSICLSMSDVKEKFLPAVHHDLQVVDL